MDNVCYFYGDYGKHDLHLFIDCNYAMECWQNLGLFHMVAEMLTVWMIG